MRKQLTEAKVVETGEKVIVGSVRPDGTVRKERRIRAGFTPQDEVQVYQSRGTVAKANTPTCPGMDEAEIAALKSAAGKGKKPSSNPAPQAAAQKPKPASSAAPAKAPAAAKPAPAPTAAVPPAEPEDPKAALEKQIRNLTKKIRQCSDLADKKKTGGALDKDQEEKLAKSVVWQEEVNQLEAQLATLGV